MSKARLRTARAADLDALCVLEERLFSSDRISRRSFRGFLTSPRAKLVAAGLDGRLVGYTLVMFRLGSTVARLYSIGVAREAAGRGIGRALLSAAETAASGRGCDRIRLEVAERNRRAARLYERAGFLPFDRLSGYYEDGRTALRFEKALAPSRALRPRHISTKQ